MGQTHRFLCPFGGERAKQNLTSFKRYENQISIGFPNWNDQITVATSHSHVILSLLTISALCNSSPLVLTAEKIYDDMISRESMTSMGRSIWFSIRYFVQTADRSLFWLKRSKSRHFEIMKRRLKKNSFFDVLQICTKLDTTMTNRQTRSLD